MLFKRAKSTTPVDQDERGSHRSSGREKSFSNEDVTPEGALSVSAVLAAFTILAEDISSLPIILYKRKTGGGKDRAYDHAYYRLLHDRPNDEHTSMQFRELIMGHLLAWGNFYGQMIWDNNGEVTDIWPLRPDRMIVDRVAGKRVYRYRKADGEPRNFTSEDILHIPAFGFDGLIGYSRIALARNAIGLAISIERFGSEYFANDARPGIVLKHPKTLSDPAFSHLRDSWSDEHSGKGNRWKPAILEEGMDLATIGVPMEDAQFLQTRKFQIAEIARIFRVPPHMIGDVERSTSWGSGIDSQEQGYVSHTLRPWMVRIEQGLGQQLLLPDESRYYFYEHMVDALLRGDVATRYEAYVKALTNGFMNPNEVRARENMNPYPGGDEYRVQLNTGSTSSSTGKPGQAANASKSAGAPALNALEPLFEDVIQRTVRREMNDLRGATQRLLAKGKADAFNTWADQFYGIDHPEFIKEQFSSVVAAQKRLFGVDISQDMNTYFDQYLFLRRAALSKKSKDEPAEELMLDIDAWADEIPAKMLAKIGEFVWRME